ncbi:hypothetical protein ABZ547_26650 [Streptomyces sparsogenes]|uniref:hypothetical protein n=1 Tax=Streptomyces sparsogenes TaxID=67365 RepID=UPI0033D53047
MTATARSPTPTAGSPHAPAAAWPTSPASGATSPSPSPPSPPWAGWAATTASSPTAQTLLALVTAFTDPLRADDELALAHQYLAGLDQRATTLYAHVAALLRDAGTDHDDVTDRATVLRTEITVAGLPWLTPLLETALAFHHAVRDAHDDLTATLDRLREATANGDYAYYIDIATAMGNLPQPTESTTLWLDDPHTVRQRWRALVIARQDHPRRTQ